MQPRLVLTTAKVVRRFGSHPERGVACWALPKKRVTVGVRPVPFKGTMVPDDDVHVVPHVALRFIKKVALGKSMWEVIVEPEYREKAVDWLYETCV